MRIEFKDDFDLRKIKDSGQCFRVREYPDGAFCFIHLDKVLYIRHICRDEYEICATPEEWEEVWLPYFDAGRDYRKIRERILPEDSFIKEASEFGKGIRILRQDPFEMLITFIISQRKNIPAISKSVEMIAESFGRRAPETGSDCGLFEKKEIYLFPTAEELACATEEDLRLCKLGYRAPYVLDAVRRVMSGELDLCKLNEYCDKDLFESFKRVNGVGDKVANCICLYAYGRMACVPVDTWIARIIELEYNGEDPFPKYGEDSGIMQQWAFYYAREKKELKAKERR